MEDFNFEAAIERIEEIENILSSGKTSLSETLELFKESTDLVTLCAKQIKEAELVVEEYKKSFVREDKNEQLSG
ncbi:MAG: exodeoxyribonuclease VII small subunit [Oscillospiraceae bacterium]|nr:exodeoxyribonuclease VII small subunit [Oscillospiraceae bacterium]